MNRRHIIPVLLLTAVLICGCSKRDEPAADTPGNADAADTYYSSYSLPVSADHISDVIDMETHICVVGGMETKDASEYTYRLTMIDKDKREISSVCDVTLNSASSSFCKTSADRLVFTQSGGYSIIDPVTGEICAEETIAEMLSDECPSVASCGDGFVFITSGKIYKVSGEGKVID